MCACVCGCACVRACVCGCACVRVCVGVCVGAFILEKKRTFQAKRYRVKFSIRVTSCSGNGIFKFSPFEAGISRPEYFIFSVSDSVPKFWHQNRLGGESHISTLPHLRLIYCSSRRRSNNTFPIMFCLLFLSSQHFLKGD